MAAVNDVFRIAVRMLGPSGQDIINVFHALLYNYVTGTDYDCAEELAAIVAAQYQDLEPCITQEQTGVDMSIQNVTTGTVQGTFAFSPAFTGDLTGDTVPPQASLYSYFRTGISRRIGKKFWGIINEASQNNGLAGGLVATIGTFLAWWLGSPTGSITGNTYKWGVYNENLIPQFAPFTEAVAQSRQKTQKRRLPGIGS